MSEDLDPKKQKDGNNNTPVLNRIVYPAGKMIIEQGEDGYRAYYLDTGRVEVLVQEGDHQLKVSELKSGDIFGEMALINQEPRSASIRAIETCTVTVISNAEIEERVDNLDDKAIRALIKVLVQRLGSATKAQMTHYKSLADFQDRITGIVERVDDHIDEGNRDNFREEVEPLLDQLQSILDKYKR